MWRKVANFTFDLAASASCDTLITLPLTPAHIDLQRRYTLDTSISQLQSEKSYSQRLPVEIWEIVIDHIACILGRDRAKTLAICAQVCTEWKIRAQMHLLMYIELYSHQSQLKFLNILRPRGSPLLESIKHIGLSGCSINSMAYLMVNRLPMLQQCVIRALDLKKAHTSIFLFARSVTSLQSLHLIDIETTNINQIGRFVTSFPSLSMLSLWWKSPLTLSESHLPHLRFNRQKYHNRQENNSLQYLAIPILAGIYKLLDFFIDAGQFVSHLQHLRIFWFFEDDQPHLVQEIEYLICHCSHTLKEMVVYIEGYHQPGASFSQCE